MHKAGWTVLGTAGLSLALSGTPALAAASIAGPPAPVHRVVAFAARGPVALPAPGLAPAPLAPAPMASAPAAPARTNGAADPIPGPVRSALPAPVSAVVDAILAALPGASPAPTAAAHPPAVHPPALPGRAPGQPGVPPTGARASRTGPANAAGPGRPLSDSEGSVALPSLIAQAAMTASAPSLALPKPSAAPLLGGHTDPAVPAGLPAVLVAIAIGAIAASLAGHLAEHRARSAR